LLDLDKIDDPLVHFDDSMSEPLMADIGLRSAVLKPEPKTAIDTAPVVGTLLAEVELITGTLALMKHRLQREVT